MKLTVTKPGTLTWVFRGGPIGLYHSCPRGDVIADIADDYLDDFDGLVLVVAAVEEWRFVLSASGKLGWVCHDDLGVGDVIAGSVYHPPLTR